jgi:IS5 family transposase
VLETLNTILKPKGHGTPLTISCRIEKIFGTAKRSYGLHRMRWRRLAKAVLQVRLTAIACNLKRAMTIITNKTA